jgi:hypothetical protein
MYLREHLTFEVQHDNLLTSAIYVFICMTLKILLYSAPV